MNLSVIASLLTVALAASFAKNSPRQIDEIPIPTNLDDAQLVTGYAAQCAAVNSAIGISQIQSDINKLTATSLAIETSFTQINTQMASIDALKLTNVLFSPTWQLIKQDWTNILWASHTTASNTAAYCTEFTTSIMPLVVNLTQPIPLSLSVETLQSYSAMADDLETDAQATSTDFTTLTNNITAFSTNFRTFAIAQGVADTSKLDVLNGQIVTLQTEIAEYSAEISNLASAMKTTAIADAATLLAFPFWGPFIIAAGIIAIAVEDIQWNELSSDRSGVEQQLAMVQANVTQIQSQLPLIASANATMYTLTTGTTSMQTQLNGFVAIWNAVRSDCVNVQDYITDANADRDEPQIFWTTTNHVDCLYEALSGALTNYTTGIANSSIPPPTRRRGVDFPTKLHANVQALVADILARAS